MNPNPRIMTEGTTDCPNCHGIGYTKRWFSRVSGEWGKSICPICRGTGSSSNGTCDQCGQKSATLVIVGSAVPFITEGCHSLNTAHLCQPCLQKALNVFKAHKEGGK